MTSIKDDGPVDSAVATASGAKFVLEPKEVVSYGSTVKSYAVYTVGRSQSLHSAYQKPKRTMIISEYDPKTLHERANKRKQFLDNSPLLPSRNRIIALFCCLCYSFYTITHLKMHLLYLI